MFTACGIKLARQRGHRKPIANSVKTEAASAPMTMRRNTEWNSVAGQDAANAPTASKPPTKNQYQALNLARTVMRAKPRSARCHSRQQPWHRISQVTRQMRRCELDGARVEHLRLPLDEGRQGLWIAETNDTMV